MQSTAVFEQEIRKLRFFENLWRIIAIVSGVAGIVIAMSIDNVACVSASLFIGFIAAAYCMVKSSASQKAWRALREQRIHEIAEREDLETESMSQSE